PGVVLQREADTRVSARFAAASTLASAVGGCLLAISSRMVALLGLRGDGVPAKRRFRRLAAVGPHPTRPVEVGEQRAQPPAHRLCRGVSLEASHIVPNELIWATVLGGDHGLAGRPTFQGTD